MDEVAVVEEEVEEEAGEEAEDEAEESNWIVIRKWTGGERPPTSTYT